MIPAETEKVVNVSPSSKQQAQGRRSFEKRNRSKEEQEKYLHPKGKQVI